MPWSLRRRPDERRDMLTQIAAWSGLFHTATGTAYADIQVDGHRETWPIRSKRFRGWLRRRYYEATGGALGAHAIRSELDLLEARAQFDAPERPVHVRVAEHSGRIYLDAIVSIWTAIRDGRLIPDEARLSSTEHKQRRCRHRRLRPRGRRHRPRPHRR
jgi:hypothetical protein